MKDSRSYFGRRYAIREKPGWWVVGAGTLVEKNWYRVGDATLINAPGAFPGVR